MASEPILAVEANIDDQIVEFCKTRPGLTEEQVVRDIARIVCIVNLVRNGTLDGKNTVLCGAMAMRCLDSPRMSVFDGDTSSRSEPDPEVLHDAISYEEEEIAIKAGRHRREFWASSAFVPGRPEGFRWWWRLSC